MQSQGLLKVAAEELVKEKCSARYCMTKQEAETLFELVSNWFCNAEHVPAASLGMLDAGADEFSPRSDFEWDGHYAGSSVNTRGHSRLTHQCFVAHGSF